MPERPSAVLVVGAGPAGSITALLLARRGVPVTLIDRAPFPRTKPCGDCLSAGATGFLRRLDLIDRVIGAGATTIDHWRIIAPDGTPAVGGFRDATALSLDRQRLDAALLAAALEAGARFRQGQVTDLVLRDGRVRGVRLLDEGHRDGLEAPLVVGADGLRSVVARRLGVVRRPPRLRKVSLTARIPERETGGSRGEMNVLPDGCIGVAPAGVGLTNVTVVSTADAADALAADGTVRFFRDRVRSVPSLRQRLGSAIDDLDPDAVLASGPFDVPVRSPVSRGVALVGDAAGYYDPFTGQGIHQAMLAAELLVDAVAPALAGAGATPADLDRGLRRYARRKSRLTAPVRRVQRGIEFVLSRPRLATAVLHRLSSAPAAMDRLVEVTGDLRPASSLLSPAVLSSFMIPRPGGTLDPHR